MPQHALVTGPITGRIPHGDTFIDVTPDVLLFDTPEEAQAAAASIEVEHATRGTHPVQLEREALRQHPDAFPDEVHELHAARHAELMTKLEN